MMEDEHLLVGVVDHLPLGVWIARAPGGEFVFANKVFKEIMGMDARPEVSVGEYAAPYGICDEEGNPYPESKMPFVRALEEGHTVTVDDIVIHRHDGRKVSIRATARPIRDDAGTITHVVIAFEDVTTQREAERLKKNIEARRERAERLEALGTLAAGVAHDFNNILSSIQMIASRLRLADRLGEAALGPRVVEEIRAIERAVDTAAPLTQSLLTFGRSHEGAHVRFEVASVVRGVVDLVTRAFDRNIEVSFAAHGHAFLRGDPSQIEQIVLNLVVNARDAMPKGGKLSVIVRATPEPSVSIEVADTGAGVPEALRTRVFEPYFTTKTTGEARGTGLGLATVYGIVQTAGGTIEIGDADPHGAVFRVTLPTTGERAAAPAPKSRPREIVRGHGRVLLVDDEPLVREAIRRALHLCGYDVIEAVDGEDAIKVFKDRHADLDAVVLDVVMPRLGGLDAFTFMNAIAPNVPVIIMSGRLDTEDTRAMLAKGVRSLLPKPFDAPELSQALADAIGGNNPAT